MPRRHGGLCDRAPLGARELRALTAAPSCARSRACSRISARSTRARPTATGPPPGCADPCAPQACALPGNISPRSSSWLHLLELRSLRQTRRGSACAFPPGREARSSGLSDTVSPVGRRPLPLPGVGSSLHTRVAGPKAAAIIPTRMRAESPLRRWGPTLRDRIGFTRAAVAFADPAQHASCRRSCMRCPRPAASSTRNRRPHPDLVRTAFRVRAPGPVR